MNKTKIEFVCQFCGYRSPKWIGKCPDCDNWNSFVTEEFRKDSRKRFNSTHRDKVISITDIAVENIERITTGLNEFDRVLGGGIVPASLTLIGGEPGVGKSTILTQVSNKISENKRKVLYVTAEESTGQLKLRAERLGALSKDFFLIAENCLDTVFDEIKKFSPELVIVDSIQTVYLEDIPSAPGSVSQVRESAGKIMEFAKKTGITFFIVGHVTKEGNIAGPRVLEHLVDTVIYFEGDKGQNFRILRAVKNRFGSTNEIGIFEMTDSGLRDVSNLSDFFISNRVKNEPGSSMFITIEGSRPIAVEIQALVAQSNFGMPRRMAMGVDNQRLNLLVAVLEKKLDMPLFSYDIYVNVAGGLKITETASDLAIAMAIVSSFRNVPLNGETIFIGEIGLLGEIRSVSNLEARLKEAQNLNFRRAFIPEIRLNKIVLEEIVEIPKLETAIEMCFL
ncbi:MAG: DNA repair protein RadA [Proteobacteria bacterium]|nr:DNA repair protein RadA [Pseudomonadota bacterium]